MNTIRSATSVQSEFGPDPLCRLNRETDPRPLRTCLGRVKLAAAVVVDHKTPNPRYRCELKPVLVFNIQDES